MTDEQQALLRSDARELADKAHSAWLAHEAWRTSREDLRRSLARAVAKHPRVELAPELGLPPLMLESIETAGIDAASLQYLLRAIARKREEEVMG